ncbi:MAG: FAD binding domain-containing protein [Elusimicrobia bacterium]|nr:FAD binding domain-containing protein [Elusimicrobiota bacterium]
MKNNIRQFCFPTTAKEAALLMAKLKAKAVVVAGGTRHTRTISPSVETVVDVSDLPLRHVKADRQGLRIGALCAIDSLEKSPVLAGWARGVIAKTAGFGSNALARGMGTVGGNVVRPHPFNNLPAVFLALDAVAAFTDGKRERTMPFADMIAGENMLLFGHKYLLTELRVPPATKGWAAAAARLSLTKSDWESYAQCVVALDLRGGVIRKAAIAVSAVLPKAARMTKAESLLQDQPPGEEAARAAQAAVVDELTHMTAGSASKAYGREVAGVLARRTLMEAFCAGATA